MTMNGHGYEQQQSAKPASPWLDTNRLREWIEKRSNPKQGSFRCKLFTLAHMSQNGAVAVTTCPLSTKLSEDERLAAIENIVSEVVDAAHTFAQQFPMPQLFAVACHTTEQPGSHALAQFPFRVEPPPQLADTFGQTEQPNPTGVIGQLQRTVDALVRESREDKNRLLALTDRLMHHIERVEDKAWTFFQQREILADAAAEREVRIHKSKVDIEFETQIWGKLFDLGAPIASKYLEKITGVDLSGKEHPLMAFAKTLTPDQLIGFVKTLTKEQREEFAPMGAQLISAKSEQEKIFIWETLQGGDNGIQVQEKPTEPEGESS